MMHGQENIKLRKSLWPEVSAALTGRTWVFRTWYYKLW